MEPSSIKIVMLGESGVGKTCLIERYTNGLFSDHTDATKAVSFKTKCVKSIDGKTDVRLMLWDTAGQEIYRSLAPFYYKDADVAILVYDITSITTFDALQYWATEVRQHGPSDCIVVLVGNKSDCTEEEAVRSSPLTFFAISLTDTVSLFKIKQFVTVIIVLLVLCL